MALEETDKLDGVAIDDEGRLVLLLTDAYGWDDEAEHLMLLQEKINSYATFVEGRQYEQLFPNASIEDFVISIVFAEPITENCLKFLQSAANQLNEQLNMTISITVDED